MPHGHVDSNAASERLDEHDWHVTGLQISGRELRYATGVSRPTVLSRRLVDRALDHAEAAGFICPWITLTSSKRSALAGTTWMVTGRQTWLPRSSELAGRSFPRSDAAACRAAM